MVEDFSRFSKALSSNFVQLIKFVGFQTCKFDFQVGQIYILLWQCRVWLISRVFLSHSDTVQPKSIETNVTLNQENFEKFQPLVCFKYSKCELFTYHAGCLVKLSKLRTNERAKNKYIREMLVKKLRKLWISLWKSKMDDWCPETLESLLE